MACYANIVYGPNASLTDPASYTSSDAVLPTTGKPKLVCTTIYGDDGVQVLYYEYELSIEVMIYNVGDVELEVTRLRNILSTPGLPLRIYPVGLGTFPVVNGTVGVGTPDLKGGPYPQNVIVEPVVTNEAITVEWRVMFRISHCPLDQADIKNLLQYNCEFDIDADHDGDIVVMLRTTIQTKTPNTDLSVFTPLVNALVRNPGKSFKGFKRKKRVSLSRDMRIVHIQIVYTEIKSDNAFFERTNDIEATDTIESNLLAKDGITSAGFYTWARNISATITLPKGMHKSFAWIIFKKLVKERLKNLTSQLKNAAKVGGKQPEAQKDLPVNAINEKVNPSWYLLTNLKITNPIYSRTMKFEMQFQFATDLLTLFSKSKIADRVNTSYIGPGEISPTPLSDQWQRWDGFISVRVNGQSAFNTTGPIVYAQCYASPNTPQLTPQAHTKFGATTVTNYELEEDISEPKTRLDAQTENSPGEEVTTQTSYALDPKNTWIAYKNSFKLIETSNNVQANYIQPTEPNYYIDNGGTPGIVAPLRSTIGFQIGNREGPTSNDYESYGFQQSETINRGGSSYQIKMQGMAIRVGYTIPTPIVSSVNGKPAVRTGKAFISHEQISASDEGPVYLAMWDITYNIEGVPYAADIQSTINSTGHPGYYV